MAPVFAHGRGGMYHMMYSSGLMEFDVDGNARFDRGLLRFGAAMPVMSRCQFDFKLTLTFFKASVHTRGLSDACQRKNADTFGPQSCLLHAEAFSILIPARADGASWQTRTSSAWGIMAPGMGYGLVFLQPCLLSFSPCEVVFSVLS